jgi:hypothetical protein
MSYREISDDHASLLRTLARLGEGSELPEGLVEDYWELKRCYDRVSQYLDVRDLAMLAWKHGYGKPVEKPPELIKLFKGREIPYGTVVSALWRHEWVEGKLVGTKGDRLMVDIGGEERAIRETQVKLLEPMGA